MGAVTATAPSRDLTDNKKKRREGSSRGSCSRRPRTRERKTGKRKGATQVEYRVEGAQDRRRRRKPGGWKETPNTRKKKGGETHLVAVVETSAASIEAWQREANTAD